MVSVFHELVGSDWAITCHHSSLIGSGIRQKEGPQKVGTGPGKSQLYTRMLDML